MENQSLRIIIFKEEDMFVAQCLEHDICVQAPDMDSLRVRFEDAVVFESEGGTLDHLPPAPDRFRECWDRGLTLESRVENAELRLAA